MKKLNRCIKFRVWNKKTNTWEHGGPNERPDMDGVNLFGETILFGEFARVSIEDLNELVALQCTGFVDVNGKDIFEGDLLQSSYYSQPVEVIFEKGGFGLKFQKTLFFSSILTDKVLPYTVVGTIFEKNLNLLTAPREDKLLTMATDLCMAIEQLPASVQQTEVSLKAANLRQEFSLLFKTLGEQKV
jgi:uncharacterized phage protein (TIGR01671 family)